MVLAVAVPGLIRAVWGYVDCHHLDNQTMFPRVRRLVRTVPFSGRCASCISKVEAAPATNKAQGTRHRPLGGSYLQELPHRYPKPTPQLSSRAPELGTASRRHALLGRSNPRPLSSLSPPPFIFIFLSCSLHLLLLSSSPASMREPLPCRSDSPPPPPFR